MKPVFASLFSGGGLVEAMLGDLVDLAFAVEHDGEIAEVYRANHGDHVIVGGVETVDTKRLPPVDILWASPPCQSHSVARSKKLAVRDDAEVGIVTLDYVDACQPRAVIIENVEGYANHPVFVHLVNGLMARGYWCRWDVLNAADFGVPQTRRRLILRAVRDSLVPMLPAPVPWIGWYAAIEDLIPTLPESKFAPWQLARLPHDLTQTTIVEGNTPTTRPPLTAAPDEPYWTVRAAANKGMPRAFIIGGANTSEGQAAPGVGVSSADEPTRCVNASNSNHWRAFIIDGKPSNYAGDLQVIGGERHDGPLTASQPRHPFRAFIAPSSTADPTVKPRYGGDPVFTVTATANRNIPRAWLEQGRVVAMTPRALARFQSVPDTYQLPEKNSLACKIIGNGVPSLMARRLVESIFV